MSIDVNNNIESIVKHSKISYMEAILKYADDIDGEIEMIAKLLNRSIKDKLEAEANDLNMMKKLFSKNGNGWKNFNPELIKDVKIFDVYQGDNINKGKKSIAFNVTLEPKGKTLGEKDIDQVSKKIISTVQETTGATLRS